MSLVDPSAEPLTLEDRYSRIMAVMDRAAILVGEELRAAKHEHPRQFTKWVSDYLPFGLDKAERLMAIARAFRTADETVLAALPPAWTALYELAKLDRRDILERIEAGDIQPRMTVAEAKKVLADKHRRDEEPDIAEQFEPRKPQPSLTVDIVARELTFLPRHDLSPDVAARLKAWLNEE